MIIWVAAKIFIKQQIFRSARNRLRFDDQRESILGKPNEVVQRPKGVNFLEEILIF